MGRGVAAKPPPGCIHHSDRDGQHAADLYRQALADLGLRGSKGRRGNPYDNAKAESLMKRLEEREEPEFAGVESLLQIRQEQSAEQARQHPYGQEETGAARNPPGAIGRDSATRDDTM